MNTLKAAQSDHSFLCELLALMHSPDWSTLKPQLLADPQLGPMCRNIHAQYVFYDDLRLPSPKEPFLAAWRPELAQ